MSDSTIAVSSKYTQDLSVQIAFFTFSCKWCLCFYFWAVIWSYIVDLFAGLHELASASSRTLLKLASSLCALLKPYGDTLNLNVTSSFSLQLKYVDFVIGRMFLTFNLAIITRSLSSSSPYRLFEEQGNYLLKNTPF